MVPEERRNKIPCELLRRLWIDRFDDFPTVLHRLIVGVLTVRFHPDVFDTSSSVLPSERDEREHDDNVMLEVAPPRSRIPIDCVLITDLIAFEVREEVERLTNENVERFFESRFAIKVLS